MSDTEYMSGVDSAWLRMESPDNLMMITALLCMGEEVEREEIRRIVATRVLRWDRFRQRVINQGASFTTPEWSWADDFSLDDHLIFESLGENVPRDVLERRVSELMSTPLDYGKPLWQFHLLEGYEEGPVLLCRLHHCLADGMALLRVLLSLTDETPDPGRYIPLEDGDFYVDGKPGQKSGAENDFSLLRTAQTAVEYGAKGALSLGRLMLRTSDPVTPFKKPLQMRKNASWSQPIPLVQVKEVCRALGATVNDVLVTAMTGALREFLLSRGEQLRSALDIRAAIPVNLRPADAELTMGNRFGLIFLSLPLGVAHPLERLHILRERMNALKKSAEPVVVYGLLQVVGQTTNWFEHQLVQYLADKVTTVVTNVPGPREQRYLAGAPLTAILPWVPQAGRVGVGLSIFSYAGEVRIGIATDHRVSDQPDVIADLFVEEFRALHTLVVNPRQAEESSRSSL